MLTALSPKDADPVRVHRGETYFLRASTRSFPGEFRVEGVGFNPKAQDGPKALYTMVFRPKSPKQPGPKKFKLSKIELIYKAKKF